MGKASETATVVLFRPPPSWIQPSAAWPQTNFGVFKSTDSGASWKRASEGLGGASVFSLAVSPHDPHLLIMGGVGSGIFVSRDAAATWHPVGGNRIFAVAGLAHVESPGDSNHRMLCSTAGVVS